MAATGEVEALIITGLPGSGRSALLASLMASLPEGSRCAVCVHHHALAFSLETAALAVDRMPCVHYSEVFDFGSGCLCCSPDGDMTRLFADLAARRADLMLTHLLIETTGVADPRPFVALFGQQHGLNGMFRLVGVTCVVDLSCARILLDSDDRSVKGVSSRGAAQLRLADAVVLNKADDLRNRNATGFCEEIAAVRDLALSVAASVVSATTVDGGDDAKPVPQVLGPVSFGAIGYSALRVGLGNASVSSRVAKTPVPSVPISSLGITPFSFAFGPGTSAANHNASCDTVCLVLPSDGGGVRLDAALAMLQMLLDCGDALRIQGYLSFWPLALETRLRPEAAAAAQAANIEKRREFPSLENTRGLPMVTVEGTYRGGPLRVRAVTSSALLGAAAEKAEVAGRSWQETAADAAAADRGACKIFVCGHGLDERALRMQLARTASLGFQGPICDLRRLFPQAVAAAVDGGPLEFTVPACEEGETGRTTGSMAQERAAAEAFAAKFTAALRTELQSTAISESHVTCSFDVTVSIPPLQGCRGGGDREATLRWDGRLVELEARPASSSAPALLTGSPLRLCVGGDSVGGGSLVGLTSGLSEKSPGSGVLPASTLLDVIVVGSEVFVRHAEVPRSHEIA
eukprot:TRINITY_DN50153_c0_g1_i1.p1 TRINITY_DN50153_c0_g1~~TRINITY_DN50153_c0_g1_i1.p1  ORF type:complete len:633 (+),score=98.81 TRINITY_DN50153_c0_g1_i1:89-1987(+)